MRTYNVLTLTRIGAEDRAKIDAVDPAVRVTDASGWFDGEYRETSTGTSGNHWERLKQFYSSSFFSETGHRAPEHAKVRAAITGIFCLTFFSIHLIKGTQARW